MPPQINDIENQYGAVDLGLPPYKGIDVFEETNVINTELPPSYSINAPYTNAPGCNSAAPEYNLTPDVVWVPSSNYLSTFLYRLCELLGIIYMMGVSPLCGVLIAQAIVKAAGWSWHNVWQCLIGIAIGGGFICLFLFIGVQVISRVKRCSD